MRIIFDMDGTLVGAFRRANGTHAYRLNRSLVQVARDLKAKGHDLIIWTFGNRAWWRQVRAWWAELSDVFSEVYTRDDLGGHMTRGGGREEIVKDIRLVGGHMLVDNDPSHKQWAERHGLGPRYVLVSTFGEAA